MPLRIRAYLIRACLSGLLPEEIVCPAKVKRPVNQDCDLIAAFMVVSYFALLAKMEEKAPWFWAFR